MTEPGEESTFAAFVAAFDEAWSRFISLVDRFPADRVDAAGPDGSWSVKQIVGHVAFWDGFEADNLARRHELAEVDWQAMNDRNIAEMAERGYGELRAELDVNHQRLAEAARLPHRLGLGRLKELTCDHYEEHAAELEPRLA